MSSCGRRRRCYDCVAAAVDSGLQMDVGSWTLWSGAELAALKERSPLEQNHRKWGWYAKRDAGRHHRGAFGITRVSMAGMQARTWANMFY